MHDAGLMCRVQGRAALLHQVKSQMRARWFLALQILPQVQAVHVLLSDVPDAAFLADGEHLHDVRMVETRCRASFVLEPLLISVVAAKVRSHDFDGDVAAQRCLVGQINLSHAASAQPSQQAKLAEQAVRQIDLRSRLAARDERLSEHLAAAQ